MAEENLKVAVRVRPFNQREKDASSKLIIAMTGNQTIISDPKNAAEPKKYAFDYSYWSHDGLKDQNGYSAPADPKYADQRRVFNDLGSGVLNNAWAGYNASLFAYGQTGSGKSYSVVGYGQNKGIVPMVCEDIFNKAATMKDGKNVEVTFSMLEIYSEHCRDLLVKDKSKTSLTIREDPKIGFYPQGLNKTLVTSYADITKMMKEGTSNRTIASTNMNATSSRAHTIVTINLTQKYKNEAGKEMAKSSLINLVDLAGSERADATGATGDRLKEGAAINLSLTSLGNVISALADNSAGKNVKVPYRDSVLTKLLMNALGGNSKTIMIAAISPADINHDETLSTLRYADRAKQIKTKAVVNEDPTEKLINNLKEENEKLKKMLASGNIPVDKSLTGPTAATAGGAADASKKEEEALKKQVEENEKAMKAMQQSYEEKLAAAQSSTQNMGRSKIHEQAASIAHLRNINMDPALSGTVIFLLGGEGVKKIGRPDKSPEIALKGVGILDEHATITNKGGRYTLARLNDAKVLFNGRPLAQPTEINHLDRLVFGTSQYFIFCDPAKASKTDTYVTFETMQDEIGKSAGIVPKDFRNMSQEEIQCQNELIDLLPAIEEANHISIALDKKVVFAALPVTAQARGDSDSKIKPYVSVRNFAEGLEWIWTKEKFFTRKHDITEIYDDFMDDGHINRDKFKSYDPFYESPDTPCQIGTAVVFPKSFAYMMSNRGDYKIVSFKSKETGHLDVEILPCNAKGDILNPIEIHDPNVDLKNTSLLHFILKINEIKNLPSNFEDVFCQFTIFNDKTVYKTQTLKGDKGFKFNFTKQFSFPPTNEFLDFLLNKCLYIQIWAEQKLPKPDPTAAKISTKEYFDREKEMSNRNLVIGKDILNNAVDPEKQKLKDDLNVSLANEKKNQIVISNVYRLMNAGGSALISPDTLNQIMNMRDEIEIAKILKQVHEQSGLTLPPKQQPQEQQKQQQPRPAMPGAPQPGAQMPNTITPINLYGDMMNSMTNPNGIVRINFGNNQSKACNVM